VAVCERSLRRLPQKWLPIETELRTAAASPPAMQEGPPLSDGPRAHAAFAFSRRANAPFKKGQSLGNHSLLPCIRPLILSGPSVKDLDCRCYVSADCRFHG
jgi:hypothetical protein